MDFKVGEVYTHEQIDLAEGYDPPETHGRFVIGEELLILRKADNADCICSFILSGYHNQSVYTCVYKD